MAQERQPNIRLGKNWIYKFIKRRPELITGRNRPMEASRIEACIPHQLQGWYTHIDAVINRFSISPQDQWNMDEIGF